MTCMPPPTAPPPQGSGVSPASVGVGAGAGRPGWCRKMTKDSPEEREGTYLPVHRFIKKSTGEEEG